MPARVATCFPFWKRFSKPLSAPPFSPFLDARLWLLLLPSVCLREGIPQRCLYAALEVMLGRVAG